MGILWGLYSLVPYREPISMGRSQNFVGPLFKDYVEIILPYSLLRTITEKCAEVDALRLTLIDSNDKRPDKGLFHPPLKLTGSL